MERNKKLTQELREQNKIYLIVNFIFIGIFLIGSFASLAWGTQYLYGSLLGLLGLIIMIGINHYFFRNFKKGVVARTWGLFFLRLGIYSTLFLVPLFTSNSWNNPEGGVSLTYTPINVWSTLIFLSIPMFTAFISNAWMNKNLKKSIMQKE